MSEMDPHSRNLLFTFLCLFLVIHMQVLEKDSTSGLLVQKIRTGLKAAADSLRPPCIYPPGPPAMEMMKTPMAPVFGDVDW